MPTKRALVLTVSHTKDHGLSRTAQIFAANVKAFRKARKMSQGDIAQKLKFAGSTIAHWETGRSMPDGATIDKLCLIFGVAPLDFFNASINPTALAPLPDRIPPTFEEALDIINANIGKVILKKRYQQKRQT